VENWLPLKLALPTTIIHLLTQQDITDISHKQRHGYSKNTRGRTKLQKWQSGTSLVMSNTYIWMEDPEILCCTLRGNIQLQ